MAIGEYVFFPPFERPLRWDLENRRSRKALTSGIIIIIIIYIGFAPVQPHANAFDLALINNHYCTEHRGSPESRMLAPEGGRSPAVPEGEKIESTT